MENQTKQRHITESSFYYRHTRSLRRAHKARRLSVQKAVEAKNADKQARIEKVAARR